MLRLFLLALVLASTILSVASCSRVNEQARQIVPIPNYAACAGHIIGTAQFEGYSCKGIAEDEPKLDYAFRLSRLIMLDCVTNEIEEGVPCTYGTTIQQLRVYALDELD